MKTIIKLVLAALVLNATWQAGQAFFRYYKFKDAVQQTTLFGLQKSDGELQSRVIQLANEAALPIDPKDIVVRRTENHIFVDATYTERIQVVPTYFYPYEFKMEIDTLTLGAQPTR